MHEGPQYTVAPSRGAERRKPTLVDARECTTGPQYTVAPSRGYEDAISQRFIWPRGHQGTSGRCGVWLGVSIGCLALGRSAGNKGMGAPMEAECRRLVKKWPLEDGMSTHTVYGRRCGGFGFRASHGQEKEKHMVPPTSPKQPLIEQVIDGLQNGAWGAAALGSFSGMLLGFALAALAAGIAAVFLRGKSTPKQDVN